MIFFKKIVIFVFIFFNVILYGQVCGFMEDDRINCLINNIDLPVKFNKIDSLILESKKCNNQYIYNLLEKKDTVFIRNKTNINDSLFIVNNVKYHLKNHFEFDESFINSKKMIITTDTIKHCNEISIFRTKKDKIFIKLHFYDKKNYLFLPINKGLIIYEKFKSLKYIKYVFIKDKLNKIVLSDNNNRASFFFNKKGKINKIFILKKETFFCSNNNIVIIYKKNRKRVYLR